MCDAPEIEDVTISTRWTMADAAAGLYARKIRSVVEVMPKAIPIAPSTSCAKKPATETSSKTHMGSNLFDGSN
jgi:hypothetical protein